MDGSQESLRGVLAGLLQAGFPVWVMKSVTPKGRVPVGMVYGRPFIHDITVLGDFTWFPWASRRNKYESIVNVINGLRKEGVVMLYGEEENKDWLVQTARHGILRRVGTLHDVKDEPMSVWQSRAR